jgi:hypothetical protein
MNRIRHLAVPLLLALAAWPFAAQATKVYPWNVTNLVAEPRVCTGRGLYAYNASWTPIVWENKPWANYNVNAHNCVTGPVRCTPTRCTVSATSCRTGAPGPWIAVQANIGKSVSGVRAAAAPPSRCL